MCWNLFSAVPCAFCPASQVISVGWTVIRNLHFTFSTCSLPRSLFTIVSLHLFDIFLKLWQSEGHRQILTRELEAVGLRLNKRPPQVSLIGASFSFSPLPSYTFSSMIVLSLLNELIFWLPGID